MQYVEVVCPMCDQEVRVTEQDLHIAEPIRCTHCYEVSTLVHSRDPETREKVWRLDYLQDVDD